MNTCRHQAASRPEVPPFFVCVRYPLRATLFDLRVADLKAAHPSITGKEVFEDLLQIEDGKDISIVGLQKTVIDDLHLKFDSKLESMTPDEAAMVIHSFWAWSLPEDNVPAQLKFDHDLPKDGHLRYILEVIFHYDKARTTHSMVCDGSRNGTIPFSFYNSTFSQEKCVGCFMRGSA
ncbi:uncharacterized protein LOC62_03G004698 [Vanrija pseudolonga]|uniref:Uncharacterized protein n=1 Tax=Vanrija pseudolonga TaxID=143232 RepID=A0AAF0Y865_9TREE|nr:hypothetical protein LOC62_03G004698 [Vanrija pseudolonga]